MLDLIYSQLKKIWIMWNKVKNGKKNVSESDIEAVLTNIGMLILTFTQWYLLTSSTLEISVL